MTGFVAVGAKYLEISRMITTTFGQRQDVMTVAFSQFNWLATVSTRAFVALVNPLAQLPPFIEGQSAIPLKVIPQTFYTKVIHALKNLATACPSIAHRTGQRHCTPFRTSTTNEVACLTLPRMAGHYPTVPRHARRDRISPQPQKDGLPYLTLPNRAAPHHTAPHNNPSCQTTTTNKWACLTAPYPITPHLAPHRPSVPCITITQTPTTKLFDDLKLRDHEAAKLGAKVANANSLAGELQNITDDFGVDLVVNHFDAELQRPASFKGGAQAHNTRPIDDDRPHVKIQALIRICVQLIRGNHAVHDLIGRDNNRSLEQVLIRLTAPASDFEASGGTYQRAFKVAGGLVNLAVAISVKVLLPFTRIINRASLLAPALTHGCQVRNGEAVLQQWGNTFNTNRNRIHSDSLKQNPTPLPDCELSRLTCRSKGAGLYPQSIKFDKQKTTRESLDAFDYMATFLNGYEVQSWQ